MIKETKSDFIVIKKDEEKLFSMEKKNIKIDFYDKELINNIINKNFTKKYKDIVNLLAESEEDGSNDDIIALKIDALKRTILNKYYKYLNKEIINKYLKMLSLLEKKLYRFEKTESRGR